jgi:hypothetical protein
MPLGRYDSRAWYEHVFITDVQLATLGRPLALSRAVISGN